MEKIYKKDIDKVMPILQALVEGKTIQINEGAVWKDIDIDGKGIDISTLIECPECYRVKQEPKYRSFKNAEECWNEMQKHQPFGWVKDRNGSKFIIENVDSRGFVEVYDEGTCTFKDVFENRTFVDGLPFGARVEE